MDLVTLRTHLRRKIGNPPTSQVADATLNEYVNLAYREIASKYPFYGARKRVQFTTEADVDKYELPADAVALYRIWDTTNKKKLDKVGDRTVASEATLPSGRPERYARFRTWVQLIPPPDDEYVMEIYYKEEIGDLTDDSHEPNVPEPWHEGIVLLARFKYYDDTGDIPKAQHYFNVYKVWLSDKPSEIDEEAADIDTGVEVPTLKSSGVRLDFDRSE